jgi:hypothetical protein
LPQLTLPARELHAREGSFRSLSEPRLSLP